MENQRAYRAICFDLDGTLLPMDIDEFMNAYFGAIAAFVADRGHDPKPFMAGLKAGTAAMGGNDGSRTNAEAFWPVMLEHVDPAEADWRALAEEFYATEFGRIGAGFRGDPAVPRILGTLAAKGYPLVLATMPMFPLPAVEWRLKWAGADPAAFARLTNYENSKSIKPKPAYFAEQLAAMGLRGSDVLMVGNNTLEDMAFLDLGADGFLVTDWLLDPVGLDLATVRHGSLAELETWVAALPACADPAVGIASGAIDGAATQRALEQNAVRPLDLARADAQAAAVAADAAAHGAGSGEGAGAGTGAAAGASDGAGPVAGAEG